MSNQTTKIFYDWPGLFDSVKPSLDCGQRLKTTVGQILLVPNDRFGLKLDCIICNAGITRRSSFTSTSNADWDDMMEVAVNSHYIIIRELFHQINSNSRIVFTASTLALYTHASVLGYGVSKSGVVALTKGLMKKFDGTGTTINAVAPGFVDTEWQKKKPQEIRIIFARRQPYINSRPLIKLLMRIDFALIMDLLMVVL